MDFEGFPLIIGWELTLACNLRCEHCGSAAGLARRNELTLAEALDICDQFPDLLVHEVDFTGGEPLMRPDWWKIVLHLNELSIKTKLITNGVLLAPDTIAQLKEVGIARVGVSIDGIEDTHDRIRKRPGLFRHILTGIKRLQDAGIPVTAITTVNAVNITQLPALFSLVQSLGIDIWQFQPIFPLGRAQDCKDLILSERDYVKLGKFTREYSLLVPSGKPIISPGDSFGYFTELDQRKPVWGGCSAGLDLCGITSDGKVKGCLSMPDELVIGDLRQDDLWDLWFSPSIFRYNRRFSHTDLGANCRSCEQANVCRGGCSSMSYACTGQLHNDPYCFYSMAARGVSTAAEGDTWIDASREPGAERYLVGDGRQVLTRKK